MRTFLILTALTFGVACSGGTTDDSGTTDSGTTVTDSGTTGGTDAANCTDFCADYATTCTDTAWDTCADDCAAFTQGDVGATAGDTLECRAYHLGAAATDAATHCPHASADGGGVCVD